jgi:hypothetical protein
MCKRQRSEIQTTRQGEWCIVTMTAAPTLPLALWDDDVPRTRRSDLLTSHLAGDQSQPTIAGTKLAVLFLVSQEGSLVGSEINDLFRTNYKRRGWKRVSYDSPRKRAGEMVADGLLTIVATHIGLNGAPEREFAVSLAGLHTLAVSR